MSAGSGDSRLPRKAMVLAAGGGIWLRPLTDRLPKCMVPVGGKPLLEHTIAWLRGFGVTEVAINLSHLPDVIRGHLGDGERWGVRITYSLEAEPLGTAGGVKRAAGFFNFVPSGPAASGGAKAVGPGATRP